MLEGYFDLDGATGEQFLKKHKRLLAVQAALEIAKSNNASQHVINDLDAVKGYISDVADAIQIALEKE